MKKKLLFTAYSMNVGGIEKALINLLKRLDYDKYEVTLILEKKEGIFLDQIPEEVEVLEYKISNCKFIPLRKIINRLKLIKWKNKLNKKYDFSCSYATYSIPGSHLARVASDNSSIFIHSNYYTIYDKNVDEMKKFFDGIMIRKFKKIFFVSKDSMNCVCKFYEGIEDKSIVCNNIIDSNEIILKSKEECDFEKKKNVPLFINVGRHDEHTKHISRIINASKKLVEDGYKFQVMLIGDGPDSMMYDDMIKTCELEDVVFNLGRKKNPYPYYRIADAFLLSSDSEGYPVVYLESMILNKIIISTKVSDWEELDGKYGYFCDCDDEAFYLNMKKFLDKKELKMNKFDENKYNEKVMEIIEKTINS